MHESYKEIIQDRNFLFNPIFEEKKIATLFVVLKFC